MREAIKKVYHNKGYVYRNKANFFTSNLTGSNLLFLISNQAKLCNFDVYKLIINFKQLRYCREKERKTMSLFIKFILTQIHLINIINKNKTKQTKTSASKCKNKFKAT